LWFFFNFNPTQSFTDLKFNVLCGEYELIFSSDSSEFGGFDNVKMPQTFHAVERKIENCINHELSIYLPSRSAIILLRKNTNE
ncbi:MAG: alpha amylase C-terminal domain-containing protein, partial [Lentisphaeria bacterium]|nr:alpha amylase C-terminal domain-containing protein [Lentisphaeria bacterium]